MKTNKTKQAELAMKKNTKKRIKKTISLPTATKKVVHLPIKPTKAKVLKITDCCAKCKKNAGALSSIRTAEIRKLSEAYKQVGISLTNLLKPIK